MSSWPFLAQAAGAVRLLSKAVERRETLGTLSKLANNLLVAVQTHVSEYIVEMKHRKTSFSQ